MQVVIINEKGAYAHLNGYTLNVRQIAGGIFDIGKTTWGIILPELDGGYVCDFPLKNIILVNAQEVGQKLYDRRNWGGGNSESDWDAFKAWARIHNFSFTPEYACPA